MDVYISSGTHSFTDHDSRIKKIKDKLSEPDVVFIEAPIESVSYKKQLVLFLFAPLLMFTTYLWTDVILRITKPLFGDDEKIDSYIVNEFSAKKIPVDVPHTAIIYENRVLWSLVNWLAIAWPFSITMPDIHPLSLTYANFLLFQGIIIFVGYLASVHNYRNQFMANQIAENSAQFSEACFVTGSKHHEPVAQALSKLDSVNVLNPAREEDDA